MLQLERQYVNLPHAHARTTGNWDHALDHGERGITSVRNLVRVISHPRHAPSLCPLCDIKELTTPLPIHVLKKHTIITIMIIKTTQTAPILLPSPILFSLLAPTAIIGH